MDISTGSLSVLRRHGAAVDRLKSEIEATDDDANPIHVISYEAADLVWAYLMSNGHEKIIPERYVRNCVAEAIMGALKDVQAIPEYSNMFNQTCL